uniref:Small ribosomal subunit protein uS3c n=1 Tax=Chlorogonium capillatum TaxID=71743 RepID=A0A0S2ICE4_9CHLO|nr:ribosomal protein S3 [Chlorogonium capillatum]
MGQKVHPLGFRVGITKKHQSQWFARFNKHKYAQSVLEDRMLRQTLTTLFPQLLNPVLKKVQKRDEESSIVPRITQIKIERGLIPYEIGIQIHAENCELIKSSIENLKINRDLVCKLQKTRRYLQHLRLKLNDFTTISETYDKSSESVMKERETGYPQKNKKTFSSKSLPAFLPAFGGLGLEGARGFEGSSLRDRTKREGGFRKRTRLSKQQFRRQRLILKRLKKRQNIRRRYKQLVYKGLFLSKKGNTVLQKVKSFGFSKRANNKSAFVKQRMNGSGSVNPTYSREKRREIPALVPVASQSEAKQRDGQGQTRNRFSAVKVVKTASKHVTGVHRSGGSTGLSKALRSPVGSPKSVLKSRIKKKFVSIFINRMNKTFLQALKESLKQASSPYISNKQLGWSKKWNFSAVKSSLALKSVAQLTKLISVLEQKSLKKMEVLRKDFIALGSISKTASFNYYQMLMFLKQLKEYVAFVKRNQKLQLTINKLNNESTSGYTTKMQYKYINALRLKDLQKNEGVHSLLSSRPALREGVVKLENEEGKPRSLYISVLSKKLNNIENECRKLKFIEYLKQLVKKHRSENIYLYLASIGEARRDLRKLQQFTKRHASFLFGLNLSNTNLATPEGKGAMEVSTDAERPSLTKKVQERVSNVLQKSSAKSDFEKTLQDIFLEQIEKQRTMYQDNVQLTPKINIKFYAVNSQSLKAKASVVAGSVVDALEKRKAFRKVIKDAKEELMRTAGVKGVKIQVSGRLNGAEIARSEWVRAGRVPLQTLRANLDYSYKTANTIYGIVGVKVWIFKGYTKLIK